MKGLGTGERDMVGVWGRSQLVESPLGPSEVF